MIILCACLSWVLINSLKWQTWHKWLYRKPFACEPCLSGWLALPFCWHGWLTPFYMAGAMVAAIVITAVINKLTNPISVSGNFNAIISNELPPNDKIEKL